MISFCFDFKVLPQSTGMSLARTFTKMCSSGDRSPASFAGLYTRQRLDKGFLKVFYLFLYDDRSYNSLVKQFGGRPCVPPSVEQLQHLAGDWLDVALLGDRKEEIPDRTADRVEHRQAGETHDSSW